MEHEKKKPASTALAVTKGSSPVHAVAACMEPLDTSPHHVIAAAIINAIDKVQEMIKDFVLAAPGRRAEIAPDASVPDDALHKTALALAASPTLIEPAGLTPEKVMDAIQYSLAFRGVENRAFQFARGIGDTIAEKRAVVGAGAKQVLNIARGMSLKADHRNAVPWLRDLEEAFRARRRRNPQPSDERGAVKAIQKAKRAAKTLLIDVNTIPQATETHTQFKAGRDIES